MKVKKITGKVLSTFSVFLIIILIIVCIPLSVPMLFGCQIYRVVSGSMEPAISENSVVYARPVDAGTLQEGDVIVFYADEQAQMVTTHRIVRNDTKQKQLETKGDANAESDMHEVPYAQVQGKIVFHIPLLGHVAELLLTMRGKLYALGFVLFAIILRIIGGCLQK